MANPSKQGAITSGISFTPTIWQLVQTARRNGYSRSRLVMMAIDVLAAQRPDIFLTTDYSEVINMTDEKSTDLQPA